MKKQIIDAHVHAAFLDEPGLDDGQLKANQEAMGLFKTDRISIRQLFNQCDYAGIDKMILLPLDLASINGACVGSNEQVKFLVDRYPDRFIGFASIDPGSPDALERLEHAFCHLKLMGLKLHPSKQRFYPDDPQMDAIYRTCIKFGKPVIFHSGMSLEPGTLAKYAHPLRFEEVAFRFPELRICLAHFGWPWIGDTCMLLLKYANIFADTALLYFDNPKAFYHQVFQTDMGPDWLERTFRHQVIFGSDEPRLEQIRMLQAIREMPLQEDFFDMILGQNALRFVYGDDVHGRI